MPTTMPPPPRPVPAPAPAPQGPPPLPPIRCAANRTERARRIFEAVELAEITLAWRQRLLGGKP